MHIEKLAHKLEPLCPETVKRWRIVRETAEADMKVLADRQLAIIANKTLGDYHNKILLSLPPEKTIKRPLHLGLLHYDRDYWEAGIASSELLQNLAIFGRSGAGKTNVAFHLLLQLTEKKIPFLFLDWKRTARHLLTKLGKKVAIYTPGRKLSPFPFNPFIVPPGLEPNVYVNHLVDTLGDAYTLGDASKSVLQKAIISCYDFGNLSPSAEDLLKVVEQIPDKERVRGWKITVTRALESLKFAGITGSTSQKQIQFTRNLIKKNTIVELDGLDAASKKFLVPLLSLWIFHVKLDDPKRERLSFVIFVEEAHHVLYRHEQRARESLMNVLLRQCREIGIGIIVVDQHPHLISSAALGNTYTSICMNLKDPTDINRAAGLSLLEEGDKKYLTQLPVGQGVVKLQDRWRKPFLVKFPLVNINKGAVTDRVLKRFLDENNTLSDELESENKEYNGIGDFRLKDNTLTEDSHTFLMDIVERPDDGVNSRYKRLGFSADKGNRIKKDLLKQHIIEEQKVKINRTRKVMLRITKTAKHYFGLGVSQTQLMDIIEASMIGKSQNTQLTKKRKPKTYSKESIAHEYWKNFYAKQFQEANYEVEIEAPRIKGRVDLLVKKNNKTIALEVETSMSNAVENVKQNLLSNFDKIVVIATDKAAFEKVEKQLIKAGYLLPGRIQIVLQNRLNIESLQ